MIGNEPRVDQLVAQYDEHADRYVLTGWLSGPAGIASLPLAGGRVVVDVDFATPGTISLIEVAADNRALSGDVIRALAQLTGVGDLAARLEGVGDRPRIVWARQDALSIPELDGTGSLGRLAILIAEHHSARRTEPARGAAALEAANLLAESEPGLQIELDPVALWRVAADSLSDTAIDRDSWSPTDVETQRQLHVAAEHAGAFDERLSRHLEQLAARYDRPAATAVSAMRPLAVSGPTDYLEIAEPESAPLPEPHPAPSLEVPVAVAPDLDVHPATSVLTGGILRVGATGTVSASAQLYLRVFRDDATHTPLAIVPFEGTAFDGANATAIVPRELHSQQLIVEVTNTPQEPYLTSSVRAVMHAVRVGQDASRYQRRGDSYDASREWARCADEWRDLEDERRANLAESYANDEPRRRGGRSNRLDAPVPLLSDLIE